MKKYRLKKTGNIYKIYQYPYHMINAQEKRVYTNKKKNDDNKKYITKQRINRNFNIIQDLVNSNFKKNHIFITLTFGDNKVYKIDDAKLYLKQFTRKLNYYYSLKNKDLKYIFVFEKHIKGDYHIHGIIDKVMIKEPIIRDMWANGFIKLKRIKSSNNIGLYLTKYLTKSTNLPPRKSIYVRSKNLSKPVVVDTNTTSAFFTHLPPRTKKPYVRDSSYSSEFGTIYVKTLYF